MTLSALAQDHALLGTRNTGAVCSCAKQGRWASAVVLSLLVQRWSLIRPFILRLVPIPTP